MNNWNTVPDKDTIELTAKNMRDRGMNVEIVKDKNAALEKVKSLIPDGSEVMTGSSTTLNQIGFTEFLKSSNSPWKDVQSGIWAENEEEKRTDLRRQALSSEFFLASVNAISQTGELIVVDATGSRVGAYPFAAQHLILVVGAQKITPSLDAAMQRIREHVFPLEDKRAQEAYGMGSTFGKWVIIEREVNPGRITVVLVEEVLGF